MLSSAKMFPERVMSSYIGIIIWLSIGPYSTVILRFVFKAFHIALEYHYSVVLFIIILNILFEFEFKVIYYNPGHGFPRRVHYP